MSDVRLPCRAATPLPQGQAALSEARETGDDYAADVRNGELDSLRRLAAEHGIDLEDSRPGTGEGS